MPTFTYQAMNSRGDTVKADIDASSKEDAANKLRSMGLYPTRIRERGGSSKSDAGKGDAAVAATATKKKGQTFTIGGVSQKQLTLFTRQLATLQDAGLPVVRSLKILETQMKEGVLKNALIDVADDVEGGATLSEAMGKHKKAFDDLYVSMVRAGEVGGVLDGMLNRLAEFKEKAQKLKRKIIGAMVYPCVVVTIAIAIIIVLMVVVVPKFRKMFEEFGTKLPWLTEMLINTSNWMANNALLVVLGPIVIYMFIWMIGKTKPGRQVIDRVKIYIPLFGPIIRKSMISRFARTFGVLIQSGVPILEALNIVRDTSGNVVLSNAVTEVHDSIREGESIAEPLRQCRIFDDLVVNMIDVGEETGDVDKMLMKVADNYDDEVDTAVGAMVNLIEPMMIVFLGVTVGTIVIALFLPLIQLIQGMGKQ